MRRISCLALLVLLVGAASARAQTPMPTYPIEDQQPAAAAKPAKPARAAAKPVIPAPTSQATPLPAARPAAAAKPELARPEPTKPAQANTEAPKADTSKSETANLAAIKSDTMPASSGVFAGVPYGERLKIQAALLWSGDFTGAANGEDPMLTAIKKFQKRIKAKVTGVLTAEERARLVAAAAGPEQEFGWSVVLDPATGIRIGLPTKMVPHAREAARGTRWSSAYGEVQVETFRLKGTALSELFEREKKEPATRKVEYSVLRADSLFVSGMQGLKRFSVRARARDGELRGFTILYDQAMEGIVAPVMVAMASAFTPFPERTAPFAALAKSVEYGNGIVVSARGHIVTDRRLTQGCQVIVAAGVGDADRVAEDQDKGLALLRVYGPHKMPPLALAGEPAKAGDLTLIGIPDPKAQDATKTLTEIKARLAEGSAIELHQPMPMAGFSGAAALDAQGRFAGMTEMRTAVLASVEPSAPPVRLISAAAIRDFLAMHNVRQPPAAGRDAKASVVRVICVRK
ncbi:MAG: trypsin-like peptidase domain-containing protein [Pseudolabrys sp.]